MYIKVRAFPKSKKEEFIKITDNKFEIKVKEKAERSMANNRILDLLAEHYKVEREKIKIINGHHSPSKLISINVE